jgi:hypothetical protein
MYQRIHQALHVHHKVFVFAAFEGFVRVSCRTRQAIAPLTDLVP